MSMLQEEFNSPTRSILNKNQKRNRIGSPLNQSPQVNSDKRSNVFDLFTVKTPSTRQNLPKSDSQDTSVLSDDVFVKPKPVSISTPSKSETRSYRDKINERFKNVKERAGKSTKKANIFKETAEKIFLDKVKRESNDVDAQLELMKNRFKLGKTEREDLYDFFCVEKCQESEEKEKEETIKSTDNLTKNEDDIKFCLPKQCRSILKESEKDVLFKPQAKPVDISDKIDEDELRNLNEEGFYVPDKPKLPLEHLYLLEQRLSRDDKKWFDCEGKLNFIENPNRKTSYRPHLKHLPNNETTTYLPATIEGSECEEIVIVSENLLQLKLSTLKFTHHPLFSLEHVFEQKLRTLCAEQEQCVLNNNITRLGHRLEGVRRILKRMEETYSQSGDQSDGDDKTEAYKRDIKILREQLFEEGKKERDRIKAILQTWKTIKKIREINGYSNTRIKLIIRKEKTDRELDKENFDKNFEESFEETLEEYYEKSKRKKRHKDEEEIREELLERFNESFRMPGEPILHFSLNDDNEITKIVENSREITRRNVVASTKVSLKIICNKMEVCKTKSVNFDDDFSCHFDETITIQLINVPKFLTIEIIEQPKSLLKRNIGEINIKLPPRTTSKSDKQTMTFEKNEIVHYKHEGVGSGVKIETLLQKLNLQIDDANELNTSGFLSFSVGWDKAIVNQDNDGPINRKIINEIVDKYGSIDLEKLSEWMHQNKPDPQDPKNSILYEYSLECDDQDVFTMTKKKNYFRLSPHMENWRFCDPKVLEENLRLKILQLRNRNEPEFDRMTIPNRIKEIPLHILQDYERRIASEKETFLIEDDEDDEIEKNRSNGRKHLRQIHIKVFQKCKNFQNNLTFEDVVDEKILHHFEKCLKGVVNSFINWFQWRPLRAPMSESKSTSQNSKLNDYEMTAQAKVIIKIISAINIPERLDDKDSVMPFVEIEYNNVVVRTTANPGPHPNWNEELVLPLEPTHLDYLNPNSLNGTIILNIFDEMDQVLTKFGGVKKKNWLGFLEIPLSAICLKGIQGMFKVKKPHLLLGYKEKELEQRRSAKSNNSQLNQQMYLNLQTLIEPNIPKLAPNIEELPCAEVPYIKDHVLKWNQEYNLNFPDRKFSVMAIDANATTTCIVRYIKPLEPPQINVEGFDVTPEQCLRYISLIPFTDSNQFYQNIWLSLDRFIHFMIGSIVDHAVALTCYLLALKLEVWLLLGFGVPYGSTAFVLIKEYDSNQMPVFSIYDVVQGDKTNLTDVHCPLQKIYCVINESNVWANTQRNDDIALMRFDFSRKSDWLPLFDNQISVPTNSVHGKFTYLSAPPVNELEIILDRKLRKKISKLRQLDRTLWNHNVSNIFKSILSSFENAEMYGKANSDALDKIKDCMATYKMKGYILNLPFTNISSIIKRIKSYGIHLEEGEDVQFASAVSLQSYPNQVLTVWIFVASIAIEEQRHFNIAGGEIK